MRTFSSLGLVALAVVGSAAAQRKPLMDYEINLDLAPEERYNALFDTEKGPQFNSTVWQFYNQYFANDPILTDVLYGLSAKRGPENDEMQGEINGLAAASGLPVEFVTSIQMMYELQTIMVPIVNFSSFPAGYEALARIPWRGPGCTGIIAIDSTDGSVNHARNLDFAPVDIMQNLVYNGIFTKGGVEVFRSQMVAGYVMAITGANFQTDNGYAIERNTRYGDHAGAFDLMIHNLIAGRDLNGWSLRKILETETEYEAAVDAIKTVGYASTEYAIVSGVRQGTIISRNPNGVAYQQTLGQPNYDERDDYIIMTNFDYFWGDVREWFDPTGGNGMFHPRRLAAQKQLNATEVLTPDALFATINNKAVLADTIFQALINVEKKVWNVSQPDLDADTADDSTPSDPVACAADVGSAATDLTKAGLGINSAVADCAATDDMTACLADIDAVAEAIAAAASDVNSAVLDCGDGQDSVCGDTIVQMVDDLADATEAIAAAAIDCQDSSARGVIKCADDVAKGTAALSKAGVDIAQAATDCASSLGLPKL
mmetsp:Transcript_110411/g.321458  ORF Transcript_110411/g.321458 Transcript_110411/m.321458 type:complete len:543 (-) Transcript_110411:349-1977(-)